MNTEAILLILRRRRQGLAYADVGGELVPSWYWVLSDVAHLEGATGHYSVLPLYKTPSEQITAALDLSALTTVRTIEDAQIRRQPKGALTVESVRVIGSAEQTIGMRVSGGRRMTANGFSLMATLSDGNVLVIECPVYVVR